MRTVTKMAGRVFGEYRVTPEHENRDNRTYWLCRCKTCGSEKYISRSNLIAGNGVKCPDCKQASYNIMVPTICECGHKLGRKDIVCSKCLRPKVIQ